MDSAVQEGEAPDAVFLSDLHLKSTEERNGQTLLRFLISLEALPKPPVIFLLGDIFDLWVSDHAVYLRRYEPILNSLHRLKEKGARVIYFEGNHDMHLAPFWANVLGAEVYVEPKYFEISGLKIRCEHGDQMNLEDKAYLRLRAVLRSRVMTWLAPRLPGDLLDAFGRKWSDHSRKASRRADLTELIRKTIRHHAQRAYREQPFDLIISGHMHVVDEWTFQKDGKDVTSINLGSWFEPPKVLMLKSARWSWKNL